MEATALWLDRVRAPVLIGLLSRRALREVFRGRADRLLWSFAIAFVLDLTLSLALPGAVLLAGPMLFGAAHLIYGARYVDHAMALSAGAVDARRGRTYGLFAGLLAAVALVRLAGARPPLLELAQAASVLVTVLACARLCGFDARSSAAAAAAASCLLAAAWLAPLRLAAAMILGHNFVAFAYWALAARKPRERDVALAALLLFSAATAAILLGGFDSMLAASIAFPGLVDPDLALLFDDQAGSKMARRAVCAFAFGQAMHYFVWLKAIPEQRCGQATPLSFRASLRALSSDFGSSWAARLAALCVLAAAAWLVLPWPAAGAIYFALAAYHGYMELAGLSLIVGGAFRRSALSALFLLTLTASARADVIPSPGQVPEETIGIMAVAAAGLSVVVGLALLRRLRKRATSSPSS